ncbi:MAG: hypothetical protein KDJ88_13950 [Bauldia sp.]|nr:hypothetical protein [Bauldia sp.]
MRPTVPALVLAASIAFVPASCAVAEESGPPPSGQSSVTALSGSGQRSLTYWSAARMAKAKSPRVLILNKAPAEPDNSE